jgi:hypothetical protein
LAEPRTSETVLAAVRLSAVDIGLVDMLDDAERSLAAAIHSSAQRDRFLAGRIALRLHAAKVVGVSPGSLQADYICPYCRHQDKAHGMPRYQVLPPGEKVSGTMKFSTKAPTGKRGVTRAAKQDGTN